MEQAYNHHVSVMLDEVIEYANLKKNSKVLDMTLGRAGHSSEFLKRIPEGFLYGVDQDKEALTFSEERLSKIGTNFKTIDSNFAEVPELLKEQNIQDFDFIFFDLGVSSPQFDDPKRGFSYRFNAPLDMRMDQTQSLTAKDVVNNYDEEKLANIIFEYGEERFSRNIARNICIERRKKKIETTDELVKIIEESIPKSKQKDGHPAKRTFQAIRIEVNNEIKPLEETISKSIEALKSGGRLCVITFHSLEDRAVKQAMNRAKGMCTCPKDIPYCVCGAKELGKVITKKPIVASKEEQEENSRSKSAKLRIFEKE